jgi:hypothetical protein
MHFTASPSASPVIIIDDLDVETEYVEENETNAIVISSDEEDRNVESFVSEELEELEEVETNDEQVLAMHELDAEINEELFWSSDAVVAIPTARYFYTAISPNSVATFWYGVIK